MLQSVPFINPNRYNLIEDGDPAGRPLVFMHGYGCDQTMWRFVAPAFERDFRVIRYDQVGFGRSDVTTWDESRHSALAGYADDLLDIVAELDLRDVVVVAHSMAATVAVLAANQDPQRFGRLVLLCPSPRFLDDPAAGYVGGFDDQAMAALIGGLDRDFTSWAEGVAPAIMGNTDRPELSRELRISFCRTDVRVAKAVARATFLSDHRADFAAVTVPTDLIATTDDAIAPAAVVAWLHEAIPGSTLRTLRATGHCPHLSAPTETERAIWQAITGAGPART
jgi:sigma-B regulation protein RsbQ